MIHDRGADVASAASITPTGGFHKVTGTATIGTITGPTDGAILTLWFGSALTVQHGTGNIRLADGRDRQVPPDTMMVFRSDGTAWKEAVPGYQAGLTRQADSTLGASAASIDFQNLTPDRMLSLVVYGRGDVASGTSGIFVRFNNDSGANYDTVDTGVGTWYAQTQVRLGDLNPYGLPGNAAPASAFATVYLVVPNAGGSSGHKVMVARWGNKSGAASQFTGYGFGLWRNTAAVTRVTLSTNGANLVAGTRATVYA